MRKHLKIFMAVWLLPAILGAACGFPYSSGGIETAIPTARFMTAAVTDSPSPRATHVPSPIPSDTPLPTSGALPTETYTRMPTDAPSITPAPTFAVLRMRVKIRAQCRYGPGWPYLYKYGLVVGSNMEVIGRNEKGTWALVQAINGNNPCWVRADLIEIDGDIMAAAPTGYKLPKSPYYGPLKAASAVRVGDTVTVYFSRMPIGAGDDSGQYPHLIEAWLCQNGRLEFTPFGTYETYAIFEDEPGCAEASHARIFGVEKHGYTRPIDIPWPAHE